MHRALITGGTSGIGASFAAAYARRGVDLVLVARDDQRLAADAQRLHAAHGVTVETITADLSDRQAQQRVADRLEGTGAYADAAPVSILVNNAGFSVRDSVMAEDLTGHDRGFEVMQRAVLKLSGAAARAMTARGQGWIINVASVNALIAQNNYSAIKAWVAAYTEALAVQLEGTGVQVTALMPGWVRTEFHARAGGTGSGIPDVLWLDPDRLVEECLADVARGRVISVPSLRWKVITAGLRLVPRSAVRGISRVLVARRPKGTVG